MKKLTKAQQQELRMAVAAMCGFAGGALVTHILYKHGLPGSKENKILLIAGMTDDEDGITEMYEDDEECNCGRCEDCGGW